MQQQRQQQRAHCADRVAAIVIAHDPAGTIAIWNRHATQRFGYTAAEAVGQSVFEILPSVDMRRRRRRHADMVAAGRWDGRATLLDRAGAPVVVESHAVAFPIARGDQFVSVMREIFFPQIATAPQKGDLHANSGFSWHGAGGVQACDHMIADGQTSAQLIAFNSRRRRKELGISQVTLAEKMGKARQQIVIWESGRTPPTWKHLEELADALSVPLQYLLTEPCQQAN